MPDTAPAAEAAPELTLKDLQPLSCFFTTVTPAQPTAATETALSKREIRVRAVCAWQRPCVGSIQRSSHASPQPS